MNTQRFTSAYYDWTHGWHGFFVAYALIAIFSLAGLRRARAGLDQYGYWPFTSLATLVAVGLLSELIQWILGTWLHLQLAGVFGDLVGAIILMGGGFVGGLYWASRGRPLKAVHGRGAVVFDGTDAQRHTRRLNADAKRGALEPLRWPVSRFRPRTRPSISNSWAPRVPARVPRCGSSSMAR